LRVLDQGVQRASSAKFRVTALIAFLALILSVVAVPAVAAADTLPGSDPLGGIAGATPSPSPSPEPSASLDPFLAELFPSLGATSTPSASAPSASVAPTASATSTPDTGTPTPSEVAATASPVAAVPHRPKVVVIVGPVGSSTAAYVSDGRHLASLAKSYGADVTELYSPNATWTRVKSALAGANLVIYLGHGNGTPSPYAGGEDSHNGMGLNASASGSNSNLRYYGETYIARYIHLAPNAVVILNHLCYASGNNEWGRGNPTRSVAIRRVDNYGEGFLKAGAAAVFAEGITDPGYIVTRLFKTSASMGDIFWASSRATHRYAISFSSNQVSGATALMDPYAPSRYYRSVIGRLSVTAADWR